MRIFIILIIIVLFTLHDMHSQECRTLCGKVMIEGLHAPANNVFVIDSKSGIETKTDLNGEFTLKINPDNYIAVYGNGIVTRKFFIGKLCFEQDPYVLSVKGEAIQLEEIIVSDTLNSRLFPMLKRKNIPTPAQRRMKAGGIAPQVFIGSLLSVSLSLEGLINGISGRMEILRDNLDTETKIRIFESVREVYTDDELVQNYKIHKMYTNAFIHFVSLNKEFGYALEQNDKSKMDFLLHELSLAYNEPQSGG